MNINYQQEVNNRKEEIIKTLVELLQIKSVLDPSTANENMPFGKGINDALEYMLNLGKKDGFNTLQDGGYAGHISYGEGEKIIGILCHLDVVPEGEGWLYPPYEAKIVDDKVYARGITDDKGPTIASYYALKIIKDLNIKLKNQIRIILGTDEETGWRGVSHYFLNNKMPDEGFAPDCSFPLVYGEKGRIAIDLKTKDDNCCEVQTDILYSIKGGKIYNAVIDYCEATTKKDLSVEFNEYLNRNNLTGDVILDKDTYIYSIKGKSAHAMEPHKGINAGTYMCDFFKDYSHHPLVKYISKYHHLSHCCEKLGLDYNDYEMGPITCNIGIIDIDKEHSRVTLDLRYPVRYDVDKFEKTMKEICEESNIEIFKYTHKTPHYVSPESNLVKSLYQAYVKNTNDTVNKPFTVGGGTYASMLENGVAFGAGMPDEEEVAHQVNENWKLESLFKSILIYIDAILLLGEVDA